MVEELEVWKNHRDCGKGMMHGEEAYVEETEEVAAVAAEGEEDEKVVHEDKVGVAEWDENKGTVEGKNLEVEMENYEQEEEIVDVGDENQTVVAVAC